MVAPYGNFSIYFVDGNDQQCALHTSSSFGRCTVTDQTDNNLLFSMRVLLEFVTSYTYKESNEDPTFWENWCSCCKQLANQKDRWYKCQKRLKTLDTIVLVIVKDQSSHLVYLMQKITNLWKFELNRLLKLRILIKEKAPLLHRVVCF